MKLIIVVNNKKSKKLPLPHVSVMKRMRLMKHKAGTGWIHNSSIHDLSQLLVYSEYEMSKMKGSWPKGGIFYFKNCFNFNVINSFVHTILCVPKLKKQHMFSRSHRLDGKIGSYNFGVVCQVGIKGVVVDTLHKNCIFSEKPLQLLTVELFRILHPILENICPTSIATYLSTYYKTCSQTPP